MATDDPISQTPLFPSASPVRGHGSEGRTGSEHGRASPHPFSSTRCYRESCTAHLLSSLRASTGSTLFQQGRSAPGASPGSSTLRAVHRSSRGHTQNAWCGTLGLCKRNGRRARCGPFNAHAAYFKLASLCIARDIGTLGPRLGKADLSLPFGADVHAEVAQQGTGRCQGIRGPHGRIVNALRIH